MTSPLNEVLETLSGSVRYHAWTYQHLRSDLGQNILDVGSGLGDLPRLFGAEGDRTVIVSDADDELVARLRRRYAGCPNYRVMRLCIVDGHAPTLLPPGIIDTITCVNMLEHVRRDRKALLNMHRILAPCGKLLLIVPALPCLFGAADQAVGHYRRYTTQSLNKKLHQVGFVVEKQRYMNFFGLFTWWLGSTVLGYRMFHARTCQRLDRIVPWLERFERMWTPSVGQSLVTVCRKMIVTNRKGTRDAAPAPSRIKAYG